MNWKKIIITGIVIAVIGTAIAFTGGIELSWDSMAMFMPVAVILILVVLLINTWYQIDILNELRSFKNQENDE